MMNSNIFLVNLPDQVTTSLLPVLQGENLGHVQSFITDDLTQPLKIAITNTDYLILYIETIDEESIARLKLKQNIPTLLITRSLNFEMERTAKEHYIDMVVNENDSELSSLIYGFIRQHDIYRFQHALVVDDSRVDSRIVANILSSEFINNDTELNSEQVIERLRLTPTINILILDYEMPSKNGCELMQEIKETFLDRSFIFIGLTGNRNGAIKFLANGADDVFIKPIDNELFTLTLRRLIFNAHKMNRDQCTLNDYKKIINNMTKEISDPIYVLTTVNDCLLEGKVSKAQYENFKTLSQLSKEKLTHTFDSFLNYFAISNYMQSSALKSSSLQSMIATQLYLESSRDKLRNIIVKKSFDDDIKNLCVPEKIGQVINQLTHDAVMRSQNGGELTIRLYTKNEDIVFEVQDASSVSKASLLTSVGIEKPPEGLIQTPILNQLLCQKIINEYDGSLGVHHENSGDVHFFKIPKKTFYLGKIYH
ncbi:ATP-binding response regulator [Colwellia hornerae]|uniref:Response regulator n=1 Tax=Colwellia hornerae TaxID=89402 RepID=A0A5C6Q863_9GAMM|nr:response regulator [Colwellia hornerae]TWX50598.1 response regulator [Colwellia hornerae]TWX56154.1 response regulator [Colwellia hornerae]TWX64998.1 response regulator [Colwellia hornerae]